MKFELKPLKAFDDKLWVVVTFYFNGQKVFSWAPSFEELYYIIKGIAFCEDRKYSKVYHEGSHMVFRFLEDCIYSDFDYEEIKKKYLLPERY